jgi:hypothetical protein
MRRGVKFEIWGSNSLFVKHVEYVNSPHFYIYIVSSVLLLRRADRFVFQLGQKKSLKLNPVMRKGHFMIKQVSSLNVSYKKLVSVPPFTTQATVAILMSFR